MEGRSGSARWGHDGYLNREHSRIEAEETKHKDSIGATIHKNEREEITKYESNRKDHERPTETELQDEHFAFRTWLGAKTKTSEACYLFRIPFNVFDHYMEYKHYEKNYKDVSSASNNQGRSPMRNVSESHEREMTRKEQDDFAEKRWETGPVKTLASKRAAMKEDFLDKVIGEVAPLQSKDILHMDILRDYPLLAAFIYRSTTGTRTSAHKKKKTKITISYAQEKYCKKITQIIERHMKAALTRIREKESPTGQAKESGPSSAVQEGGTSTGHAQAEKRKYEGSHARNKRLRYPNYR